jgi:hypothetical protein
MLQVMQCGFTVAGFVYVVACPTQVVGEGESFNGGIVAKEESRAKQISR